MEKTVKISALRIAAQLDLNDVKGTYETKPTVDRSFELFYSGESDKYAHYFNYGVAVFTGYQENEISIAIDKIKGSLIHPVAPLRRDYAVKVVTDSGSGAADMKFESDYIVLGKLDAGIARTIMF